jgi:alkylresorcinol/alkylpyrone synthase
MSQSVKLVSVATVVPPYIFEQRDVAGAAHRMFALRFADFERLARVFKTSGIRRRHAVRPIEWCLEPLGWPERSNAYRDGACQLFVDAANKALDAAGIGAAEVDTVVTISSTGIATPSLEARAAAHVGFRRDVAVSRYSVSAAPAASQGSRSLRAWRNRALAALCCWLRSKSVQSLSDSIS